MSRTIDAEDAIKRIRRLWTDDILPEDRYDRDEYARGLIDAIDAVDDSPTVEREPGEWVPHPTEPEWSVCSSCGTGCKTKERGYDEMAGRDWVTEFFYKYCPNCGAPMKGADDEQV